MNGASSKTANSELAASIDAASHPANRVRPWMLCLAALPAILPIIVISKYHVDFIWNDAWDLGDFLVRAHQHVLRFGDFWTFHNEHRMPIPYLVMFVLARLTHWNTFAEVYFGYAMVCLLSVLLGLLLKSSVDSRKSWIWQWFLINMLIFSPIQCENWGFGFAACQNFIPIPCLVGAILLLCRPDVTWRTVLVCGLLIEIASLSMAVGLLGWLLLIPLLASRDEDRRKWFILVWLAMTMTSFVVQFWGYQTRFSPHEYYVATWADRIQFFFVFLGNPLNYGSSTSIGFSVVIGVALAALFATGVVWLVRRWIAGDAQNVRKALPWLVLGGYALGASFLGALGRSGLGLQQAAAGRYVTISICLLVCFVGLMSVVTPARPHFSGRSLLLQGSNAMVLLALVMGTIRSTKDYEASVRLFRAGVGHLAFIDFVFEPHAKFLVAFQEGLRERADTLDEMGCIHPPLIKNSDISLLEAPDVHSGGVREAYGAIDGGMETPEGNLQIGGWAVLPAEHHAADMVLITCDDENNVPRLCATAQVSLVRLDVVNSLGNDFNFSGWAAEFPISRLTLGLRLVRCWAYDSEHQKAYPLPGLAIRTASK